MLPRIGPFSHGVAPVRRAWSLRRPVATRPVARIWVVSAALLAFLALPAVASATALPEKITENTTLTAAGNPYTGKTTIESGVTLKVEPGVEFTPTAPGPAIKVEGTLDANGTAEAPIVFNSTANRTTIAFEPGSGASVLNTARRALLNGPWVLVI